MQNSYDYNIPIIVATSTNPEVKNILIDGRNRAVALFMLEKKGVKVKFPKVDHEEIESINELRCRIGHYVMRSRSRNSTLAKKIIEADLRPVIESQVHKNGDKLPGNVLSQFGFNFVTISNRLIDEVVAKRKPGALTKSVGKPLHPATVQ
jgi:hypothetical protein